MQTLTILTRNRLKRNSSRFNRHIVRLWMHASMVQMAMVVLLMAVELMAAMVIMAATVLVPVAMVIQAVMDLEIPVAIIPAVRRLGLWWI